ncbi:hypothetical protein COMA1_10746 [Candidatus Nitrospira nitrosa]|uniref:Uncharacterized protein n=1 Tax=Candidatus Nitrospira nitrosa TaxID=1742972 RepID=A0A0S4L4I2_9BACT|nr:hypothetical protein COMA1_10746 [Candidatus Nitrospira nitrosa]
MARKRQQYYGWVVTTLTPKILTEGLYNRKPPQPRQHYKIATLLRPDDG